MSGHGPGGNLYDKYATRNPVAKALMRGFLRDLDAFVAKTGAREVLEVGCGEGHLSRRLFQQGYAVRAVEPSSEAVAEARSRNQAAGIEMRVDQAAVEELSGLRDGAPLVLCCEVLEHVADPVLAVERLGELASPWLVASVPREPLWRALNMARGAYWGAWGNTPGHVNHWSRASFLGLLSARFEIVETRTPTPWTLVLGRSRRAGA